MAGPYRGGAVAASVGEARARRGDPRLRYSTTAASTSAAMRRIEVRIVRSLRK
jgi:hypothetical protein